MIGSCDNSLYTAPFNFNYEVKPVKWRENTRLLLYIVYVAEKVKGSNFQHFHQMSSYVTHSNRDIIAYVTGRQADTETDKVWKSHSVLNCNDKQSLNQYQIEKLIRRIIL